MRIPDLNERPSSRSALASWYAGVLDDQEASGLSVADYARELGVSAATLYQWRRRLSASKPRTDSLHDDDPVDWIEVDACLGDFAPDRGSTSFVIRTPSGLSIEVSPGFDSSELTRLIAAVEAPC